MKLILLSGAEATCKSDLAKRLARELGYAYQSKDHIKEALYDKNEHNTWDFGWYETRAKDSFFRDIEAFVTDKTNAVIESNFIGEDKKRLRKLLGNDVQLIEIHCYTKGLINFRRAVHRNESGARHPGHHDRRWYPKVLLQSLLHLGGVNIGAHKPVGIGSEVLLLDTSAYPKIDFDAVTAFARGR